MLRIECQLRRHRINRLVIKSDRADYISYHRLRLGQRLNALNKSIKGGGKGLIKGGEPISAWRYRA